MTREEAIKRFENVKASALVQKASGVSEYWQGEIDGTIEAIDMAIESLSIVRCKDCRHRVHDESRDHYYCSMFYGQGDVSDENFCQWGERREP